MGKFVLAGLTAFAVLALTAAHASTVATVYSFCKKAGCPDGSGPNGLVTAPDGTIYGTASGGGKNAAGTAFALVLKHGKWKEKVLYDFCAQTSCGDGSQPHSKLILDKKGNLYGTTLAGGVGNLGTVFELTKSPGKKAWTVTTLASFCTDASDCGPSQQPLYGLAYAGESGGKPYDGKSPLYGVAVGGNQFAACKPRCGTVYQITLSGGVGTLATIYQFCAPSLSCPDGWSPVGEPIVDSSGTHLFGAVAGGMEGSGGVFELALSGSAWNESVYYASCQLDDCDDGASPSSALVTDASGNLYGATGLGGANNGGVAFKLTPGTTVQETTLYIFCAQADCADGREPNNLLIDGSGNVFGSTFWGGGNDIDEFHAGGGTVFEIGGSPPTLYSFCAKTSCADGEYPAGQMALGPSGTIIGATETGGAHSEGVIYQITP